MVMKYKEKVEFPFEAKDDGVLVMPVNMQGCLEFGKINRRFRHEYPITSKLYLKDCIVGEVFVGDFKEYTERDRKIVLLYYKTFEIAKGHETDMQLDLQMVQCIKKLFNHYPEGTKFYSPVIPFPNSQMVIVHNEKNYEWVVLKEG